MKILIFGDIIGRIGREAVKQSLPGIVTEHAPDFIVANAENLASGKGVTERTLNEMREAGIEAFTSGNDLWKRTESAEVIQLSPWNDCLLRPANYPPTVPGRGWNLFTVGAKKVLVINLLGRVFVDVDTDDPFRTFDRIVAETAHLNPNVVLVDFHAEATSEKVAFGWHVDGRATAVWGTHTHVPTRDARVLPEGTAYITDVGMCGYRDGVIGVEREPILRRFMSQLPVRHEVPSAGEAVVNALVLTVEGGKTEAIEHVQSFITI